jgi:hypothetical protein
MPENESSSALRITLRSYVLTMPWSNKVRQRTGCCTHDLVAGD